MADLRILDDPKALLERKQIGSGGGPDGKYIIIEETWDITAPDCPFVVMDWREQKPITRGKVLRQVTIPESEWPYGRFTDHFGKR